MKAIIKREVKSYFTSVLGWIFLAAFFFVFNLYFWAYSLNMGYPYLSYTVSSSVFICLVIIPILTMRSMAEDRRTKTDQLLYTAPVSVPKVILGKFFAMVIVFSIAIGAICLCPLIMNVFGTVPYGESYAAILGIWLFGLLAISIGLFLSTVTESQVIAAVLSFGVLFLCYMMSSIISLFSSTENLLTKILGCLAITDPMDNFLSGVVDVTGIIYYISGTALFLFFTCQLVQKHRWSVSSKKIRRGVFNSTFVVIGAAIVVVVNVLAAQLPEGVKNVDATNQKLYTLTEDTCTFLDDLDQDVTIYVLEAEDSADTVVTKTLKHYEEYSDHITVEYVDPTVSPNFYTTYTDTAPTEGSLIVAGEAYSKVIDYDDIYEYTIDYSTYTQSISAYDGEGQITSALSYVTSGDMQTVYTITGHGETDLDSSFTEALEKMNLSVESMTLLTEDEVPEDAAALIINGPTSDFSEDDAQKVIDYLAAGGKALITTSYEATGDMTNFDSILAEYGVGVTQGVVMESDSQYCYQYPFYLLPDVQSADATANVDGYVMIVDAQALTNLEEDSETLTFTSLLETSENAYVKTDIETMTTYSKEDGDEEGTFILGANVVDSDTGAEITVIASVLAFNDNVDSYVSGQNLALFKGIVSGYSTSEVTVSIDAKEYSYDYLTISQAVVYISAVVLIILIPVVLIVVGILIWYRRRKA
ncbi:MAG: Gldg family protein [Lachnospiraceae bacterium]|nr:Gldg family protein [Lachnospiraceae bacterium]